MSEPINTEQEVRLACLDRALGMGGRLDNANYLTRREHVVTSLEEILLMAGKLAAFVTGGDVDGQRPVGGSD